VTKLGFINDRPEFKGDAHWSTTGDRYPIKLLRDFVFHRQHDDGTADVDFVQVVNVLNMVNRLFLFSLPSHGLHGFLLRSVGCG